MANKIRFLGCAAIVAIMQLYGAICPVHAQQETTKDMLAAQLRLQGYSCAKPLSARRDARQSRPDEAVWVLRCRKATYRMRLVPDMAAQVELLRR